MNMDNFDLIERYIQDKLTPEEKVLFEDRLEKEPALRNEKDEIADLILGVESYGLKQKLHKRRIGEKSSAKTVKLKPKSSFRKLAIAASIAAIFFCGWFVLNPTKDSRKDLFVQAFSPDPGLPTPMSETKNYNFYDAMVEYKVGNYEKAIEIWNSNVNNVEKDTINYYLGMAHINAGKLDLAHDYLFSIENESAFYEKSKWFLLSILIRQEKYKEAKTLIKSIPSNTNERYDEINKYLQTK